jgi:hypothetical protein
LWVAISLVSLILVIILILCVPLDFVFCIDTKTRPRVKLSFVWFFGLIDKEIKKRKKKSPEKEDKVKPVKKSKSRMDRQLIFRIIKIKGLFRQLKQFIKDLIPCFKLKEFIIDFKFCPEDPADMGILYALALSFNSLTDSRSPYRINIWPTFEPDIMFDGKLAGTIRLQPVKLFKPVARFVFSIPIARLLYTFISSKWKKEK